MHLRNNALFLIAVLAVRAQLPPPPPAAPPAGQQPQEDAVFRSDVRLVELHASVADKKGNLLTTLPQSAFTVLENGVPQQIKYFKREDVPVSLGVIIDDSGSMRDKRAKVSAAALQMIKSSNKSDEVFIVNFNDTAYLDVPFTNSIGKMEEGLSKIEARGGTAMRDAVSMSLDYTRDKAKHRKKVLLVITDGDDTASAETLEKLVAKCQRSEVLIYAIGILSTEEARKAKVAQRALSTLSTASGGVAYFPKELMEVESIALQVANEIRNQYIITYSPTRQELDGSFRSIKVTVAGKGSPIVRTRTGYYATPLAPIKRQP